MLFVTSRYRGRELVQCFLIKYRSKVDDEKDKKRESGNRKQFPLQLYFLYDRQGEIKFRR